MTWIYVDKDWKDGDSIVAYGWDTATGLRGDAVGLQDYFSYGEFKAWHKLKIPLTQMGLAGGTIDALRVEIITAEGKSPKFWIDDIDFEAAGASIPFTVKPDKGTWLYVQKVIVTYVDALNTILQYSNIPNLDYSKILGETLVLGWLFQRVQDNEIVFSSSVSSLLDSAQTGAKITTLVGNATNTMLTSEFTYGVPEILKAEDNDELRAIMQDSMVGFVKMRMSVIGYVEKRV